MFNKLQMNITFQILNNVILTRYFITCGFFNLVLNKN